ncbi:unnamed protein product, partial [marine sediment metagenome]
NLAREVGKRARAEGHTIEPAKGKKPPRVKDFKKCSEIVERAEKASELLKSWLKQEGVKEVIP